MPQLDELIAQFYSDPTILGKFAAVLASNIPEPYRGLLAHSNHMTVTVEAYHGCPVDVEVLESRWITPIYHRKILLRKTSDRCVVQFGLVRLDTSYLTEHVRNEILAEKTPLGRVLIENGVMRKVHLADLWRIECGEELASSFGLAVGSVVYGRTARIDFDDHAALQLLEIVTCPS